MIHTQLCAAWEAKLEFNKNKIHFSVILESYFKAHNKIIYRVRASTNILSIKYTKTTNFSLISSSNCPALASEKKNKKKSELKQFLLLIEDKKGNIIAI